MAIYKTIIKVQERITNNFIELPVIFDENGKPFYKLVEYCLIKFTMGKFRLSSLKHVVYAVELYLNFNLINKEKVKNSKEMFKLFFEALYKGTINNNGFDESELYWKPFESSTANIYLDALSKFGDWLHNEYGAQILNPMVENDYKSQLLLQYAYYYKNKANIFSHIQIRKNMNFNFSREYRMRNSIKREKGDIQQFPDSLFKKLIMCGYDAVSDRRMAVRDILILILIHECGLRISEALHLWIMDVNILNKTVKIFHPKSGNAPCTGKKKSRQDYLWENYKLKPRTEIIGNQHLGWKGSCVNKEGAIELYWKDDEMRNFFFELWTIYLSYMAVLDIKHPYAFVNFNKKDFLQPYTLSSFQKNYVAAMTRIGEKVDKQSGLSTHGHRHNYAMSLKERGHTPLIIQRALHQSNIYSQEPYVSGSYVQALKIFKQLESERNNSESLKGG
ncbi:gamma-mobile-trio recombinase GmtY [Acinetobacter pittii]|uniref:gamma-mobile-trio recombinase GmtY n=1 Tax=Acinetobacter pittii TaxID=48296 RepID=UPI003AF65E72